MIDWLDLLDTETCLGRDSRASLALVKYLILLDKWRPSTNLVASSTTAHDLITLHIADSLALLPHVPDAARLIDVGSGGGLPGAVLAIVRPELSVTAIEPAHKKHAFLAAVRRELQLDNFQPLAERDDQHRGRPDFRPYDVAVSRAAFPLADWLTRGAHLVRPGGRVLGMEGRDRFLLPAGACRHPYRLSDRNRAIIEWRP